MIIMGKLATCEKQEINESFEWIGFRILRWFGQSLRS